jgi:hypothetical protein
MRAPLVLVTVLLLGLSLAGCGGSDTVRSLCEEAADGVCNRLATCGPLDLNSCVDMSIAACCQAADCSAPRPAGTEGCIDALGTLSCDDARAGNLPAECRTQAQVTAGAGN